MKPFLVLLVVLGLATACASFSSWKDPSAHFEKQKRFYVESELADGQNLHTTIATELRARGYNATSGFLTMMPANTDILVSFHTRWTWDFTTYLIELDVQMRDAKSGKILASVSYHRPGVGGTSTEALIQRVLNEILGAKKV